MTSAITNAPEAANDGPTGPHSKTATITVMLCLLVTILEGFDLQAAGVAAPGLLAEIALGDEALGWFFSSSTIGLIVGALLGGRLADMIGRKRTLIGAVITFGAASVATGLSNDFTGLLWARAATGLGIGGALPILIVLISENASPRWKNTAITIAYAGMPLGGSLAAAVTLYGGGEHWRMIFFVGGFAPLLVAPLLMLFLPESRQFRAAKREAAPRAGILTALTGEGRWAPTLLLWGAFFAALLVLYLLLNWLPSLMVRQGFSPAQAATFQIVFNLTGAAGALAAGAALDRLRPWAVAATIFAGAGVAILALASAPSTFVVAALAIALVGVTILAAQAILYAFAPSIYPVRVRGAGMGSAVAAGRAGSVAGPLIAGTLLGAGQGASDVLYLMLPLLVLGGVLAACLMAFFRPQPGA